MIKESNVYVKIGSWNHFHYKELGYDNVKNGNSILVKVKDLTKGSHVKITAICEVCGCEKVLIYKSYINNIKNNNIYNCKKCCYDIMKKTLNSKYGVKNVSFLPEVKEKIKIKNIKNSNDRLIKRTETNLKKYGVKNVFQSDKLMDGSIEKAKNTHIKNGNWIDDSKFNDWQKYKKNVMKITYRNKNKLFENWNGYDYYDNEYIKDNYNLHYYNPDYPTIDHKISIKYGYNNNISVEEIANINNLCITKKRINTSKYTKCENDFLTI